MTYQVVDRCDFKSGDIIDNRYSVRKSLGDGSFGVVLSVSYTCLLEPSIWSELTVTVQWISCAETIAQKNRLMINAIFLISK